MYQTLPPFNDALALLRPSLLLCLFLGNPERLYGQSNALSATGRRTRMTNARQRRVVGAHTYLEHGRLVLCSNHDTGNEWEGTALLELEACLDGDTARWYLSLSHMRPAWSA